jgi:hypothetical protein
LSSLTSTTLNILNGNDSIFQSGQNCSLFVPLFLENVICLPFVSGYLVFYTTDPSQVDLYWTVDAVLANKTSITISKLMEDTTYYFKVQALDKSGYGPMSSTLTFKTPIGGYNVHVYVCADTSLPGL